MLRLAICICVAAMASGCAQLTHFKSDLGEPSTGVSVDIKQRMVFKNRDASTTNSWPRICAEPSPDALSSLGASLGASFLRPSGTNAQLGSAISESAAFVGLRTQSIQLMRDAMYRACEAYMSGAITNDDYLFLQRRFQAQVVGLLAIEQLTGTVAAQPVTVQNSAAAAAGGGATAEADRLAEAKKQLAAEKVKQAAAKQEKDAAQVAYDQLDAAAKKFADKADSALSDQEAKTRADLKAAKAALTKASDQLALENELVKIYEDSVATADEDYKLAKGRVRAATNGGASTPLQINTRPVSDQAIATVATSVQKIVGQVFVGAFNDESGRCMRKLYEAKTPEMWSVLAGLCTAIAEQERAAALKQMEIEKSVERPAPTDDALIAKADGTPPPAGDKGKGGKVAKPEKPGDKQAHPATPPKSTESEQPSKTGTPVSPATAARIEAADRTVKALSQAVNAAASAPVAPASAAGDPK